MCVYHINVAETGQAPGHLCTGAVYMCVALHVAAADGNLCAREQLCNSSSIVVSAYLVSNSSDSVAAVELSAATQVWNINVFSGLCVFLSASACASACNRGFSRPVPLLPNDTDAL